jgi:hypothetical protein
VTDKEIEQETEEAEVLQELIKDPHLLTPIVLIGASALIPVPFLDDVAKEYLEKYLFGLIAEKEGLEPSKDEKYHLTQEPSEGGCCALGCMGSAILYPIKKLLRKLFFFLEIKRAVDQSTTALAHAYLFKLCVQRDLWKPGLDIEESHFVRKAIVTACQDQGVKPLETAARHGFEGTKGLFFELAAKFSKKTGTDEKDMAKAVDSLEKEESQSLAGLTQNLSDSLGEVSDSYLVRFASTFEKQLVQERSKPKDPTEPTA